MIKMLMFDVKETEMKVINDYDTSDYEITYFRESLNINTKLTVQEYDETSIISVFITSDISKGLIDKFKNLRVILTRSICHKHIDINECRRRNIAVINVNDYARESISQYVIGVALGLSRNLFQAYCDTKQGKFDFEKYESENLDKLSLGVIGTGSVGSAVCELGHKLGMKIYANDIVINNNIKDFAEYVSLNDLIRKSDIITLHIPYNKDFKHMISFKEFKIMKDGAYIINTSDCNLINPVALYRAIKDKKLNGAGLDLLLTGQKDIFGEKCEHVEYEELENIIVREKLLAQNNVLITPRISYDTKECLTKIIKSNFHDLKDYFIGRKTNRVV